MHKRTDWAIEAAREKRKTRILIGIFYLVCFITGLFIGNLIGDYLIEGALCLN